MECKLFSVVILCYRHFEYLYSAIDSVLKQDYANIQLIISDDGSSNFPKEEIEQYISEHREKNVSEVIVRQQKENSGTVKHLNHAVKACSGEYVIALAGDDTLYDKYALTKYAKGFENAPENCWIEMAQTGMYDEKLDILEKYFVTPLVQKALEETERDTAPLLELLIQNGACLPSTSTCFKKGFFERFGSFDESYMLVEDYPMHVRLAEEGWIIHYENFIAIKHRHGGISHGQKNKLSRSVVLYLTDTKRMTEEIIFKKIDILPEEMRSNVLAQRKRDLRWIEYKLAEISEDRKGQILLALKNPGFTIVSLLRKAWVWAYLKHINQLKFCLAFWFLIPSITQMADFILPGSSEITSLVLYISAAICFLIWIIAFVIWGANKLLWAIERFPNETLAIG